MASKSSGSQVNWKLISGLALQRETHTVPRSQMLCVSVRWEVFGSVSLIRVTQPINFFFFCFEAEFIFPLLYDLCFWQRMKSFLKKKGFLNKLVHLTDFS